MKRQPLGIQTFAEIAEDGYLYVDKTAGIHRLLTAAGKVVFLSRPRRFGKSLLCSTLQSLFEGRRDLFAGLAIDALDWDWIEYPVIHIDFNAGNYMDGEIELLSRIDLSLKNCAEIHGVTVSGDTVSSQFQNLIMDLNRKCGQKVAVIVEEYDKPLLNTLDAPDLHEKFRGILKGFFGVLKSADAYLKFSFITGVTKFSKVSIFSDLNRLDDVSLRPDYADICGVTQMELERDFADRLEYFAGIKGFSRDEYRDRLREIYNGYRFSKSELTVYNPFGLINHFMNDGDFSPYWFESGSPAFLYTLMQNQDFDIVDLEETEMPVSAFTNFDIDGMQLLPLLYQSGYLTIKDYDEDTNTIKLGFPNEEVWSAFSQQLIVFLFPQTADAFYGKFPGCLIKGQPEEAMDLLHQFLASIPYDVHEDTEKYYQGMIDLIFRMFGMNTRSEVRIATGRIDTLVETRKYVYCFEYKLNHENGAHYTAQDALSQIDTKEYLTPWKGSGKKLHKIGVVFDFTKRNMTEWEITTD
jgi:hypothetical protein